MPAQLVRPTVMSIYRVNGNRVLLPERMARCTPDMKKAIYAARDEVEQGPGRFALSDLFRSYDMQLQAHLDFVSGKKKAFSPPPGASMHEAGRAFDVDLESLKMPLANFWEIVRRHGVVPIIDQPDRRISESWHFECRGSHQIVYDYYRAGRGTNFAHPAAAMAASAILAAGIRHDLYEGKEERAYLQSALIRLGNDIGNIDGDIGPRTMAALVRAGIAEMATEAQVRAVDAMLGAQFPAEFFDTVPDGDLHFVR